jgi:FixJ family two-component response regulator
MFRDPTQSTERWVGIIDDDRSIRRALARALVANGIVARAFSSAEEYLDREPPEPPACLVLDVRLSGLSGIELHDRLEAGGSAPPTIFITAMEELPTAQLMGRAGPRGFLRKPFSTDELVALVRQQVGGTADAADDWSR